MRIMTRVAYVCWHAWYASTVSEGTIYILFTKSACVCPHAKRNYSDSSLVSSLGALADPCMSSHVCSKANMVASPRSAEGYYSTVGVAWEVRTRQGSVNKIATKYVAIGLA